jgi:8-oxo-dGTP diphosphatase
MPGGKLEFGESFEEAAIRETQEETGIKLHSVKVITVQNDKNEFAHFVTIGLFSDNCSDEPKVMEPDEIVAWKWFDVNKLPSPVFPPSAKLLERYLQKKFYIVQ